MNIDTGTSMVEVLAENYHGIGAIGFEIVKSVIDDLAHERFDDEWLSEMGNTRAELSEALQSIAMDIIEGGYLFSMRTPQGWVKLADHD